MSKHTPGPWTVCSCGQCHQVSGRDHPVATVTTGKWGDDYPTLRIVGHSLEQKVEAYMEQITYGEVSKAEAEANGRLICAAPDLLEALKLAHDHLCVNPGYEGSKEIAQIRAALDKAEGR